MHSGLLGFYWTERAQSFESCVAFCHRVMHLLHEQDFGDWIDQGQSCWVNPVGKVDGSPVSIGTVLELGVARHELSGQPMPELGYGMHLWTDRPADQSTKLTIYLADASKWGGNCVLLKLPRSGPDCLDAASARCKRLIAPLLEMCQPHRAIFCRADDLRWSEGGFAADVPALWKFEDQVETWRF